MMMKEWQICATWERTWVLSLIRSKDKTKVIKQMVIEWFHTRKNRFLRSTYL